MASPARQANPRLASLDTLRGFVMVVMVLDHTREFFTDFHTNPLDPQRTTLALYLTRWITHLCAPVFVALAGASIYLQRWRTPAAVLAPKLLKRGFWLIALELTVVHFVFQFAWTWNVQVLEVIWAIGASMVVLAGLMFLPVRWVLLIAAVILAGHNLLDPLMPVHFGPLGPIWQLLHVPGFATGPPVAPPIVLVAYPLLPWLGVMLAGYAFGPVFLFPQTRRRRIAMSTGAGMLAVFAALRLSNLYGDPVRWSAQPEWWRTVLSFFNVQKYPPSLLFVLVTLGLALIALAYFEFAPFRFLRVYGRVPLFFFVLHLALVHALALLIAAATGGDWKWWVTPFPKGGVLAGYPPGYGYGLGVVWSLWVAVVLLCYPACRWFGGVKERSRNPLLSYL